MFVRGYLVLVLALVLVVAACGGSDDDGGGTDEGGSGTTVAAADDGGAGTTAPVESSDTTTSAPADSSDTTTSAESGGGETPEVTEMGSFTVNGTEFAVTFLNRCIPFGGEDGVTIDLQPIAQGQGAQLNLYGTADSVEVSVQGSTISDMFGSIAFAADPFGNGEIQESSIDGDRWTGSATLNDALQAVDPVDVTWDVMIPPEAIDCSL